MRTHLTKLVTKDTVPVSYSMQFGKERIELSQMLGKKICFKFFGEIICTACGKKTNRSFSQGHCYSCFRSLPQCDICIVKPELCHYNEGTCREPSWGESYCFKPHYVYLANSSSLKVGITRATQIPTRWLDQGAVQALPIFKVHSRMQAGLVEVVFKTRVADRTNWRKMLKGSPAHEDMEVKRDELLDVLADELNNVPGADGKSAPVLLEEKARAFEYPVVRYPKIVKSLNFDLQATVEGVLEGVKGQYLMLDTGVLNIRKFAGYHVEFFTD